MHVNYYIKINQIVYYNILLLIVTFYSLKIDSAINL